VTPYFVTSKMTRQRTGNFMVCTEMTHAEESLNKLGYGMQTVIPWFNHFIQYKLLTTFSFAARLGTKQVFSFRSRALKKLAEKEKENKDK